MKQKVVIKISLEGHKSRSKALKTLAGVSGVESVVLKEDDKNKIEVIGDGMDTVKLITLLRKKSGYAQLLSIGPADSDKGTAGKLRYRKGSVPGNPVSVSLTDESEPSRRSRSRSDFPTSNVTNPQEQSPFALGLGTVQSDSAARVIQLAWRRHHTRRLKEWEQKNLINELRQGRELAELLKVQLNTPSFFSSDDQAREIVGQDMVSKRQPARRIRLQKALDTEKGMDSDTDTATGLRYRKGSVPGNPVSVSLTDESESSRRSRSRSDFPTSNVTNPQEQSPFALGLDTVQSDSAARVIQLAWRRHHTVCDFPTSNVKSLLYLMKCVSLGSQSQYIAWIRIILFLIPSSVDPLAFYIPAINDDKKCLNLNKQFPSTAFAFSLACKIFVVIVSLCFMIAHLLFKRRNWQRYKLCSFLIDFLISVPVLEMVNMTGSGLWDAINFFKLVIVIQYVARIIRIYSSFSRAIIRPRKLVEATWPRVAFNLFLYLQAANVFGGLWYFMAIKREIECWNKACINHTGQRHCSFNCNDSLEDYTFVSELCPTKKRNTTIHDFGIFHGALESGIAEDTNILQKFLHCFVWGLQNLSNLGHNLQTSSDLRENIFVILVVSSGLMLFVLLIGNLQTYLLSRTVRLNEMTKKPREIEEWEPFQKISKDLQQQVKKYKSYIWRKTNHIDVESLLNNLPKELRMEIKRELCWPLLKKVQECMMLKEETLDALCDLVKPAFFTDHTYILREGDPIDEMIFVLQGKLLTYTFKDITSGITSSDNKRDDSHSTMKNDRLQDGDFYGEELIDWALRDRFSISLDIPKSNRTIQALTNVEAFILMVDDLKIVYIDMMNQAARVIQLAWRRHHTRRLREWEQKNLINELTHGRELAELLQFQLNTPSFSSLHDQAQEMLVQKIISSYEKALYMLNFSRSSSSARDPQLTGLMIESPTSLTISSWSDQESEGSVMDPVELKDGSKKRKTLLKWTSNVRATPAEEAGLEGPFDDGYSWRKYGQKDILGANYPRGYYRCTHRYDKGCLATKQVQRSDEDPMIFEITYRGYHTCTQETNTTIEPQQHNFYQKLQTREQAFLNLKKDLKIVTQDSVTNPQEQSLFALGLGTVRSDLAARVIQLAWRRHHTRRLKEWAHKNLINELRQRRELAELLKVQLNTPSSFSSDDQAREMLAQKIMSSYEKVLPMLNFNSSSSSTLDPQLTGLMIKSPTSLGIDFEGSVMDPLEHKAGSIKRKTLPTRTVIVNAPPGAGMEEMLEDGYSWRKYGQKDILGAKYPRSYYRCIHKIDKGCLARKRVQRSDEDPTIFEITYSGYHTCTQETNTTIEPQQHNISQKQQQPEPSPLNLKKGLDISTQEPLPFPSFHPPSPPPR